MTILKIVIFTVVVYLFAYYLGGKLIYAIGKVFKTPIPKNTTLRLFAGAVNIILVGTVICSIGGLFRLSAHESFAGALVVLIVVYAALYLIERKSKHKGYVDCEINAIRLTKKQIIYILNLAAIICFQIVMVINYSFNEAEAIRNIDIATKVYDLGYATRSLSIMNLWGCVSSVMGIHPLVLIHTYLPTVTIILFYLGYFEVLRVILDENITEAIVALVIVAMLNVWGYQSELLAPFNLLVAWYTGAIYIVGFLLPFVACIWLRVSRYKISIKKYDCIDNKEIDADETITNEEDEDYLEEWDMKKHKIINARNLAIAMGVLVIVLVAIAFVLNNKINSLHDSTANLQRAIDSRCAMFEFVPEGGRVEGYLIKGSDGSLTMIGGGSDENADALMQLIDENAINPEIDNWYLYSNNDEDMGAYARCIYEKGLSVKNAYVLEATSIMAQ